jgi:hypothetical protein
VKRCKIFCKVLASISISEVTVHMISDEGSRTFEGHDPVHEEYNRQKAKKGRYSLKY